MANSDTNGESKALGLRQFVFRLAAVPPVSALFGLFGLL